MRYQQPLDIEDYFANGFYRAAPALGLNPNILGARIDMTTEKVLNGDARLPDVLYFRGHMPSKGEFSFALTAAPDTSLRHGHPVVKLVAWRYIERLLRQPGNCHLLENENVLGDLTTGEFTEKLETASREHGIPEHLREILVEAARRLDAPRPENTLEAIRGSR
jgi:hypothetical protein